MKTLNLEHPITAFYVKAKSFPDGVLAAHQTLHAMIPYTTDRKYFGISHGGPAGKIVYLAAASELVPGDLKKHNLPEFVIRKGAYVYSDIEDFRKKLHLLDETFTKLLKHPQLDPAGYCLEWYLDENTCRCLVKLKD
jgi:hypothetical protein